MFSELCRPTGCLQRLQLFCMLWRWISQERLLFLPIDVPEAEIVFIDGGHFERVPSALADVVFAGSETSPGFQCPRDSFSSANRQRSRAPRFCRASQVLAT